MQSLNCLSCHRGSSELNLDDLELVVSSGGSAAILAGVGTFLATELAGITKWRRLSGVSGGAVITSLAASGMNSAELLHTALDIDFDRLITWSDGIFGPIAKLVSRFKKGLCSSEPHEQGASNQPSHGSLKHPDWRELPHTGLFGSAGLAGVIAKCAATHGNAGKWPENYSTMATTKEGSQVVFNKDGVFIFPLNGEGQRISSTPVPLAFAVRASSTIPGVLAALEYKGISLFDGALSRDGLCPVGVQIRNFNADPTKIIACRVGEDNLKPIMGRLHRAARVLWRVHPHFHWGPETHGVMEFRPQLDHVQTMKFKLSRDEKWFAILNAFETCLSRLALEGIIYGDRLKEARAVLNTLGYWRDAVPAASCSAPQAIAINAERSFNQHCLI